MDQSAHHPEAGNEPEFVPWTPHEARRHLELRMRHASSTEVNWAYLEAAAMLDWMQCPHRECPCRLLEHEPLAEDMPEEGGDEDAESGDEGGHPGAGR